MHVEEKLVDSCCNGEKSAYATLVKTYSRYVFAICLGIVGNIHDAEDIAQQTLLKGFTDIKNLQDGGRFKSWIGQIARNQCIDFLRKQKCDRKVLAERFSENHGGSKEYPELQEAIVRLQKKYRLALVLYYLDERSTGNIAEALRISQNAVQARISRGRKQLRKLLAKEI